MMSLKYRYENKKALQKWGELQDLCNKYGDYEIAYAHTIGDQRIWTQRHSVLKLWHMNLTDKIIVYPTTGKQMSVLQFVSLANNRTIFESEVVLDLEDPTQYEEVYNKCVDKKLSFDVYRTGSRGYHFHLTFSDSSTQGWQRKKIRELFIYYFGTDLMKSSDKTTIALPGAPHWKTGIPKTLIVSVRGPL